MSLTTDIAALLASGSDLINTFNTRKASIDNAVAAALAAIPSMQSTFYVDAVNGSDVNAGSEAAPLQTIERAVELVPAASILTVILMSDYHVGSPISSTAKLFRLYINGYNQVRRKLSFGRDFQVNGNAPNVKTYPCFISGDGMTFSLSDIEIVWPPEAQAGGTHGAALFTSWSNNMWVRLTRCIVTGTPSTGANRYLVASYTGGSAIDVRVVDTTYAAALAGVMFFLVAAGGNPNSSLGYRSNITAV